ncbi:MAG: 13E12 repeat family protein, partial [Actinomycetota bacterium]|nr:13E12 repeat family protein [Actinomycetota bacterium]
MTSDTTLHPHPGPGVAELSGFGPVAAARAAVSEALAGGVWSRSDADLVVDVRETLALRAQVDALLLAQVAEVDSRGIAARRGCPSTRAWLRSAHRIAPGEASALVRTALSLRDDLPAVGAALGTGGLSLEQAKVCVHAIADLPAATPVAKRPQAEATMIDSARSFDPVLLARIGRRLAEIIDPEGVQARDEQPICNNEADAYRGRELTLTPSRTGSGGTLRATLDATGYATLTAYLTAATAPRLTPDGTVTAEGSLGSAGSAATAVNDTRTVGQRRHDALVEVVRQALTAGGLPSSGGVKPRIVVTIPYECLIDRTGAGRLADGTLISPSLTRQLADDGEIVPVWLSSTGIPLDVGRSVRLFTGRTRTALDVRDRGCAWPGCDRPPSWTQA